MQRWTCTEEHQWAGRSRGMTDFTSQNLQQRLQHCACRRRQQQQQQQQARLLVPMQGAACELITAAALLLFPP